MVFTIVSSMYFFIQRMKMESNLELIEYESEALPQISFERDACYLSSITNLSLFDILFHPPLLAVEERGVYIES
jgi:hypothetical protein